MTPKRGWRWWLRVLMFGVPMPPERPLTASEHKSDAYFDAYIEASERASIPCVMCDEFGEPHACERAWWQQKLAHLNGRECADAECICHPDRCVTCGQPVEFQALPVPVGLAGSTRNEGDT